MSEQLAGDAGVIQHVPEVILEPSAQAQFEGSNLFDRLRNKWTTIVATGTAAIALATSPVSEQPAYAANTETAVIGMPFAGGWSNYVHPSTHPNYGADWATDVYAPPGTEARLEVGDVSGDATYTVSNVADTSCGAGKRVRVDVEVDNVAVGWVQYEHLDTNIASGMSLQPGGVLGKTKNWGNLSCYAVSSDSGVHLHVGMKNTQDNHSCYVDNGAQGTSLGEGDAIGVLGSTNNGIQQSCAELPDSTKVVPLAGNWVGASNQDLLYATEQSNGGIDFGVWESRPTGIVWHSRGGQPGIDFDDAKLIPNDMDGDGLTDMLYATPKKDAQGNNLPQGFDVGYLRNDGNQFVYGGTVWNEPNLKLGEITFLPGNWSGDSKGDVAYVTPNKQFSPQRGIDVAVRRSNGSSLVWDGLWWPDQNLKYATTKYIPTDIDGNGKLDLLYASEHNGGGFDIGLQANTGSGFQWAGHQWYSGPSMDLKSTRFIPGNWANPTRQGFAYVTKRQGSDNGFDLAVMDMTPSGMVWRGIWWPNSTLNYQDVKFMPADVDGNGYSDLFYASSWQPPSTTGFDMALQANTGGNGLTWVGHQWNPNNLKLKDTKFLPGY